jgi:hypothetical protein
VIKKSRSIQWESDREFGREEQVGGERRMRMRIQSSLFNFHAQFVQRLSPYNGDTTLLQVAPDHCSLTQLLNISLIDGSILARRVRRLMRR